MAALSKGRLFGRFWSQPVPQGKSKKAHEIALRAYKQTNGATEELKRLYKAYRENQAKPSKAGNVGDVNR